MNWPRASEKGLWATVNSDLIGALEWLKGTVKKKLEKTEFMNMAWKGLRLARVGKS